MIKGIVAGLKRYAQREVAWFNKAHGLTDIDPYIAVPEPGYNSEGARFKTAGSEICSDGTNKGSYLRELESVREIYRSSGSERRI